MKIIFNCHTEYDLPIKKQSFGGLADLIAWFNDLKIPITYSLAVGGPFDDRLLNYFKNIKTSPDSELAIHFHSEIFKNNQWQIDGFLESSDYQNYLARFKEILGQPARTMVFGKWRIDEASLEFLSGQGIEKDGSWVDKDKVIAAPFKMGDILEIPAASFRGVPLNPLTKLSHFFILRKIIKKYHQRNLILHIGFHSYDFPRPFKKKIFENILNLIKKYDLPIMTLSQTEAVGEDLLEIKPPLLARLFNLIGH